MGLFDKLFSKKVPQKPKASDFEGPPMSQAVEYAKTLHSDLLKDFDDNTQKRIAQIISNGIKNKRGLSGISVDIRKEFPNIPKHKADIVALTETNIALSEGAMQKMRAMGVDGKEWIPADANPCEMCAKNVTVGVIPIDVPFPSGHIQTPAHDGCRCCISPARLNRKD
jgi:hypothetical protein